MGDWMILILFIILELLNLTDLYLTLKLTKKGCIEWNPIFNWNKTIFIILKLGIIGILVLLMTLNLNKGDRKPEYIMTKNLLLKIIIGIILIGGIIYNLINM